MNEERLKFFQELKRLLEKYNFGLLEGELCCWYDVECIKYNAHTYRDTHQLHISKITEERVKI